MTRVGGRPGRGGSAGGREALPGWADRHRGGTAMLVAMLAAGVSVPLLSPYHPNELIARPFRPPSFEFFFGTDQLGRDVFTRVFSAVYRDLGVAFLGVSIPLVIGTVVGVLLSISRSRIVVSIVSSLIDAINALPLLVLAIALIALFGPGLRSIVIVLAMTNWARYARIARTRATLVEPARLHRGGSPSGLSRHAHFRPAFPAERLVRDHRLRAERLHPGHHADLGPLVPVARGRAAHRRMGRDDERGSALRAASLVGDDLPRSVRSAGRASRSPSSPKASPAGSAAYDGAQTASDGGAAARRHPRTSGSASAAGAASR